MKGPEEEDSEDKVSPKQKLTADEVPAQHLAKKKARTTAEVQSPTDSPQLMVIVGNTLYNQESTSVAHICTDSMEFTASEATLPPCSPPDDVALSTSEYLSASAPLSPAPAAPCPGSAVQSAVSESLSGADSSLTSVPLPPAEAFADLETQHGKPTDIDNSAYSNASITLGTHIVDHWDQWHLQISAKRAARPALQEPMQLLSEILAELINSTPTMEAELDKWRNTPTKPGATSVKQHSKLVASYDRFTRLAISHALWAPEHNNSHCAQHLSTPSNSHSLYEYEVTMYQSAYEPYVHVHRHQCHECFTGYGANKVGHLLEMYQKGNEHESDKYEDEAEQEEVSHHSSCPSLYCAADHTSRSENTTWLYSNYWDEARLRYTSK
ncbi:glycosyltransferase family 49 protein [Phanerochaete carnosa HHB-10118-sp]|uniref:Glycosyltransferase family 49 protein n=1 Tax=Phanerochaete carnosa (strain HHB-10118-sp) TaxID=650164 RepID=K5WM65_PHACS|nr:glycosyltransferase family 49 protein [Phanerochaete carnosa HHB-10118-sp]EKM51362.1 glycosyltransferase family 49 protein [Phanerochaete carnosa HHB-10118-sp]